MPDAEWSMPDGAHSADPDDAPGAAEEDRSTGSIATEPAQIQIAIPAAEQVMTSPDRSIGATPQRRRRRAVAIAVIAAAIVSAAAIGVTRSPIVHARTIRVHGMSHLSRADVLRTAQIAVGVNVFMLDAAAAERRLEADPWVEEATISKHLPSTLIVQVQERSPVAIIRSAGLLRMVAGDGTLLDVAGPELSLPLIASAEATVPEPSPDAVHGAARAVSAMALIVRRQVEQVAILADGTLRVDLLGGAPVSYGAAVDLEAKAQALQALLRWASGQGAAITSADVRVPSAPTARLG